MIAEETHPIMTPFASYRLCSLLDEHGVTCHNSFYWKEINNSLFIESRAFDYDNYYENCKDIIHKITRSNIVPAFSITDLEQFLPPYLLEKTSVNNQYKLLLDEEYKIEVYGNKLADMFANAILLMIEKKMISTDQINKQLNKL